MNECYIQSLPLVEVRCIQPAYVHKRYMGHSKRQPQYDYAHTSKLAVLYTVTSLLIATATYSPSGDISGEIRNFAGLSVSKA